MKSAALLLLTATVCLSQPAIGFVANAASNIPLLANGPGVPIFANGSLALGAMFVVKGSGLGPSSIVVANSYPLKTTLGGTSVQVTVAGQTTNAIMYYTESQQIAAILPSTTHIGFGQISVSYNGHQSPSFPITVVQNNVAMYTIGQTGAGDAVVTLADNSLVLPTNSPNPGDVVVLWANGLGPVPYDETSPSPGANMSSVPLEVFVGGQPAKVLYRGRNSCCVSLDQINVQIPAGVSTGCVVSIVMRIGNLVSNTATTPIASSGRVCTPTNRAISESDVQRLTAKDSLNIGIITLERSIPRSGPLAVDPLEANLRRYSRIGSLVLDEIVDVPAPGSCTVAYNYIGNNAYLAFPITGLDAGSSVMVSGATSATALSNQGQGLYKPGQGHQFLAPGPYTVTANGGADVGAFQVTVNVPQPFTWSKLGGGHTIDRSQGLTLTWAGEDPSGYVIVSGWGQDVGGATSFSCTARASDASLTISPFVLQALPAFGTVTGALQIEEVSQPRQFTADGLDLAIAWGSEFDALSLGFVEYQ